MLGLHGCVGFSVVAYCSLCVWPLAGEHGLSGARAAVAVAHRLSCPVAGGIFPDQGPSPCLLHRRADSLPLSRQGSPAWHLVRGGEESQRRREVMAEAESRVMRPQAEDTKGCRGPPEAG